MKCSIEELLQFISAGKLILGVCNGFQLMVKLGLLPALDGNFTKQSSTLTFNDSGRFEDRWIYLKANAQSPCIFTKGIDLIYLPVRHGEGKFVPESNAILKQIEKKNLFVFQYCTAKWRSNNGLSGQSQRCGKCHCRNLQ